MAQEDTGRAGWIDLTVDDAPALRDFYSAVMGWTAEGLDMGGYDDYVMTPEGAETPAGGICHRRGQNADGPPQWIVYFVVPDVDAAVETAVSRGGTLLKHDGYALIQDPAGAIFGLHSGQTEDEAEV